MPELEGVGGGQPDAAARRAAPARARGGPRAGSRPGRPPPARPAPGSTSASEPPGARGHDLDARAATGRRPASAPRRRPGRPAGRRSRPSALRRCRGAVLAAAGDRAAAPTAPKVIAARGEPSSVTAATGSPIEAARRGRRGRRRWPRRARTSATAPYRAATRRSRRSTAATCEPKTPAVVVALVDDDVAQRAQERRPPLVPGQQRVVQQVGVGEDVLRVVADPAPLLRRGVAVVGGRPQPGQRQRLEPGQLVGGQRLGRATGRARSPRARRRAPPRRTTRRQRRQQVAQALAGRGARGDDDVPARVGELGRLPLVRPQRARPRRRASAAYTGGFDPVRPLARSARRRAGTSWTCTRRSARRPAARRARAAAGSKPAAALAAATRSSARRYAVRCDSRSRVVPRGRRACPEPHQGASVVDLSVASADRGDVTVVHVAGEIDVYTAPACASGSTSRSRPAAATSSST